MNNYQSIINELKSLDSYISEKSIKDLKLAILSAKHIFLAGAGRSGLMINALANRLMHLGFFVSVIGEITAPHSKPDDLMIIGSNSGETARLINQVRIAKKNGVKIALITAQTDSTLVSLADFVLFIPTSNTKVVSHQPMGSLFEQASLIVYDSVILELMEQLDENSQSMRERHADIE